MRERSWHQAGCLPCLTELHVLSVREAGAGGVEALTEAQVPVSDDRVRDDAAGSANGHQHGEALATPELPVGQGGRESGGDRAGRPGGVVTAPAAHAGSDEGVPPAAHTTADEQFLAARGLKDWPHFERQHGAVIARHAGATVRSLAVLTTLQEIHVDLPPPTGDAAVQIEDLVARCERLQIEAHQFLTGRQRRRIMHTIFSIVKQLLAYLDRPGGVGQGLDTRALEHQIAEVQRTFRRAAQWNAQMEYFRGVAWTTTLLTLLIVAGIAGMYSWDWWLSECDALGAATAEYRACEAAMIPSGYLSLFVTTAIATVVGSIVVLLVEARFSDSESIPVPRDERPSRQDDASSTGRILMALGRGLLKLLGLMVIVGSLAGLFATIAFVADAQSIRPLLICLLAGLIGATVSVMWRMSSGNLVVDYETPSSTLRFLGGFRPIVGSVFGVTIYILLAIGLINVSSFAGGAGGGPNLNLYFALAFLAGFSERLAPDMLDEATRRMRVQDQADPAARPGRDDPERA
jgi:hypothetical protein